jgi:hypothetical protein
VLQQLSGRAVPLGECFAQGARRLLPVVGTGLAAGVLGGLAGAPLVVGAGLAHAVSPVFLLPALLVGLPIFLHVWASLWLVVPVAVVERGGVRESLARSRELCAGSRAQIALLLAALVALVVPLGVAGGVAPAALGADVARFSRLVEHGAGALSLPFFAVLTAVAYHDLRTSHEGIDSEQLAAVLD